MKNNLHHIQTDHKYQIKDEIETICESSRDQILKLINAKILITGGTGFFGIWLINSFVYLREKGQFKGEIFILTRDRNRFQKDLLISSNLSWITIIEGDVKTVNLADIYPDHLIHFASTSASETFNQIEQLSKIDTLYLGTKNIMDQCGDTLQKVLFASSGTAYGQINVSSPLSEDQYSSIKSDDDTYALCLGKVATEFQIKQYAKKFGFKYSIARCFSFAGEFMPLSLHYAFGNFIANAKKGENIIISGNGEAIRSYMYVGDAIVWFLTLLTSPKNDIFNVGSDEAISIKDLAKKIAVQSDSKVVIENKNQTEGNFSRSVYLPSLLKINSSYPKLQMNTKLGGIIARMLKV